jgi:hypothetical protein
MMMSVFKRIPAPLQRQTLTRLGFGAAFFVLTVILAFTVNDIYAWLPCAGATVFSAVTAVSLFRRAALGEYVAISGICLETGLSAVRRRARYILLQTEKHTVRATLHGNTKKIPTGSQICLYLAKNTPIYEKDGVKLLYIYLALEIK